MFNKRLTWFWILLTAIALVIVGRLIQIQVVDAQSYQELAKRILTQPVRYINAPRGTIYDRHGVPLLRERPCSDICIHYGALVLRPDYLEHEAARILRERGDYPRETPLREIAGKLPAEIERMWQQLSELTGLSPAEIARRAADVCDRVERIRAAVQRRSPKVRRIAEEDQFLPVLQDVDDRVAHQARLELSGYPWLRVVPSSRRAASRAEGEIQLVISAPRQSATGRRDLCIIRTRPGENPWLACIPGRRREVWNADPLVHVLGRMGAASPERIAEDPFREDEFRRLGPGDQCGISGIERLAETSLRGRRGRVVESIDGRELERSAPVPGHDVYLTIDADLQQEVTRLLEETMPDSQYPAGAAAVVIDVATREVLALASYPGYRYERFNEDYAHLRRDALGMPLRFRAVAEHYPPGSICKAITLVAGLSEGVITAQTRIHCTGHLLPDVPNRFRCWIYNQHPGLTHDMTDNPAGQDAVSAVRNSCNIYFYTVGGLLKPARLCEWFRKFGLGRPAGTGLIEESMGIVPTEQWLQRVAGRSHRTSDAWNFAIGQGEVTITPLQAANVAASIASGEWKPVRLAYDETGRAFGDPLEPPELFSQEHLGVLRRGMWQVVNEQGGTAPRARLDASRFGYVLCGKTGSAQTPARPISYRYTFEWPDGRREEVTAYLEEDARARFGDDQPELVGKHTAVRYPALEDGQRLPAHAWFIGFTQPASTPPGACPTGKVYAIAVIVEFGGSGGRVAGPVAKRIAEYLLTESEP